MEEIMLKIDNVSKMYRLGQIGGTTLRDELQRMMAKLRNKEDPTRRIGSKSFGSGESFTALNGVSLEVKKGERVGIIGHNGAGKSTLLKLISRVTAPTGGTISMNGRVASMLEVGTGFHGELTGRENIYMNGAILGMTKKEIDSKIEDIIEFSECRQFIDTPVKRYSSGMYVKLAFSVAAHLDSEVMIMDEVLAVGDMAFQQKCLDKMNDVSRSEGRTILYVSHNMNTIRQLCDRVVVLDHGKVIFDGEVEEGIGIYAGSVSVSEKEIDLSIVKRKSTNVFIDDSFRFTKFKLSDRDYSRYDVGEKMRFVLNYTCKQSIKNIVFRVTMLSIGGNPVATTNAENDMDIDISDNGSCNFLLDTSMLAPGRYTMRISANVMNEYYNFGTYDVVDEGTVNFEIVPTNMFNRGMQWNSMWWGHTIATPLSVNVEE